MGVQMDMHAGPAPWIYARQGCPLVPGQPYTPIPGMKTPWHEPEASGPVWWHDGRNFDPAEAYLERMPNESNDSNEERGMEKQTEDRPDLGPYEMPPTQVYMPPHLGWFDYMQRMRSLGPMDPWLAYSLEQLGAPMHRQVSGMRNGDQPSGPPMSRKGEFSKLSWSFRRNVTDPER